MQRGRGRWALRDGSQMSKERTQLLGQGGQQESQHCSLTKSCHATPGRGYNSLLSPHRPGKAVPQDLAEHPPPNPFLKEQGENGKALYHCFPNSEGKSMGTSDDNAYCVTKMDTWRFLESSGRVAGFPLPHPVLSVIEAACS